MKTLACRDMGSNCPFIAKGETVDEVIRKMAEHHKTEHPQEWQEMKNMSPEDIKKTMMRDIKDKK